jgi:dolichol-phosphate mannosyltransferase
MLEERSVVAKPSDVNKVLTVVIPTLNEEHGIAKVLEELRSLHLTNILVVDGYSKDKTVQIASDYGAKVVYQQGKGKTGALKSAIDVVETPYMLIMDGDFTYDASCVNRLLQHLTSYDEIIGARVPTDPASMTGLHKFGNKVITNVFNLLLSTKLTDVCSGMYVLRTDAAREIDLSTTGFDVEAEIAAQVASSGKITEVPINYRPRMGRQKLSTWKHGFKIIKSIINLGKTYNPGVFYSMLSSLMIIPAAVLLAVSGVEWYFTGDVNWSWFFVGISMLLVAVQAMGIGVVSLILRRTELRTARRMARIMASIQ